MRSTLRTRTTGRAVAAIAVGALALGVTACGGDDDKDDDGNGKGGGKKEAAATVRLPELDGQKLSVSAVWGGAERKVFLRVLDEFEKRTGADVSFVPAQEPIISFLASKVAGGEPPDVAMLPQVGAVKQAVEKKWAKPLGAAAQKELDENYAQGWKDLGSVDGKQYGVYFKAANKSLVWYNTKVFENAGVEEPKTWDDFMKTAQTIYDSGVAPVSVGGAEAWTLTDWFENVYLSQAGPEKYDELAQHEIKWTDPSVKEALTTLGGLFGKKGFVAGGADGALQTEFPASVKQTFVGGDQPKAGMVFEGDMVSLSISETKAKVGTDAKVFPFPAVGDASPAVVGGDAAVALKDGEGAQALLTFLASPDAAKIWAEAGGFVSPNKNLDLAAYPNDVQRGIAKALIAAGDDIRFDMSDQAPPAFGGTPGKGEWKALQDFLKNPKNVAGTQRALEDAATKAYPKS
ncbi:ABC transporter substrate-binding protein [Streptomyces spectabilis]|uniref:Alpha-glucoside transport system substrate-binding protein n=1 Tax=Streptomyces spectabilis TaxID=68270 RepID=A0A5P2X780_STRST|nr:extracellular solute-binding protein [Streptomyces spectabilis]MBB5106459.1 alpha-glucoside transport system substrate-binding protein [Streptomyces spectabilis]MCI3903068.1 extracellular solute-binding protein [Streptomyces spectabilis]QEV60318.1 extracellular solute-binding protein [Streptomyces spectabilis]GGV32543.1 sugar ABC transporter substrate-binding protein [Streptomyces spectabilis]